MKKWVLIVACALSSIMVSAQSKWSVTPEAGVVVNKENGASPAAFGFKAGVGVGYQLKEAVGNKPAFGLKSGLFVLQQRGDYHAYSGSNMTPGGQIIDYWDSNATRYYLQLPVMAQWSFKLCDDVKLNLAVGPYVAVGLGGNSDIFYSTRNVSYPEAPQTKGSYYYDYGYGYYGGSNHYSSFNPFKGTTDSDGMYYEASPRFDWGGTASVGITVKRVSFSIGYDLAWGKIYKKQNDLRIRNHMVSFTFGYTF